MRRKSLHERLLRLEACSHQEESPPSSLYLALMAVILDIPPAEVWQVAQREARKEGMSADEWLDQQFKSICPRRPETPPQWDVRCMRCGDDPNLYASYDDAIAGRNPRAPVKGTDRND